ncbi:MAG TPA: sporulation integral membrane protein YtvI [Bacillales bacterium]|nr:sporulation integral membrane protein YtvI [Bacillales bacterium]
MTLNYFHILARFMLVLLAVTIGFFALYYIAQLTVPFIIAVVIAFLMNPLVNFLHRTCKIPRGIAVFISIIIIFALIAGLVTLIVFEIISGITYLTNVLPDKINELIGQLQLFVSNQVMPMYNRLLNSFHNLDQTKQQTIINNIQDVGSTVTHMFSQLGQGILSVLSGFVAALPSLLAVLLFTMLGTFFISKDWYKLGNKINRIIPERAARNIGSIFADLKKALFGFIRAQLTLISITAAIDLVGLLILRVDYAISIAIITGLVDLMPYLGTGAVFVPWILYCFFTGNYFLAIGLSILYGVIIIQRQMMEPKIISSSIGLDPLATLVALFIGIELFGFLGLIVGPVVLVIIKTLHNANVFRDVWGFIIGQQT